MTQAQKNALLDEEDRKRLAAIPPGWYNCQQCGKPIRWVDDWLDAYSVKPGASGEPVDGRDGRRARAAQAFCSQECRTEFAGEVAERLVSVLRRIQRRNDPSGRSKRGYR